LYRKKRYTNNLELNCVSKALGCRMAGSRLNLTLLIAASLMLVIEVLFVVFPEALWSLMMGG